MASLNDTPNDPESSVEIYAEEEIDLHSTDAGVAYLAALHAVVPEYLWGTGIHSLKQALSIARDVPTTADGIVELRAQYAIVSAEFAKIDAAREHLESAARALGIEDEKLLEKLVVAGLRTIVPKRDRLLERGWPGGAEHLRRVEEMCGHLGFWAAPDLHASYEDISRACNIDKESEIGGEWVSTYFHAIYVHLSDAPTGGGARQPSPAGIVTRMMWKALGGALRKRTETWSPVVGATRLLNAYTPHKLTPKRFRQVIDAARDKNALVGLHVMKTTD